MQWILSKDIFSYRPWVLLVSLGLLIVKEKYVVILPRELKLLKSLFCSSDFCYSNNTLFFTISRDTSIYFSSSFASIFFSVENAMYPEGLGFINYICIVLIFMVGLPHGAIDGALAQSFKLNTRKKYVEFLLGYQLCALAVILFWYLFPGLALTIFLLFPVFHFGSCDWLNYGQPKNKFLVVFTHGMLVIFGVVFFNEKESYALFSLLSNRDLSSIPYLFWPGYIATTVAFVVYVLKSIKEPYLRVGVAELSIILLSAYFFSVLVAFTIYFCFIHSLKHTKHVLRLLDLENVKYRKAFFSAVVFTLLAWLFAYIAFKRLHFDLSIEDSLLKVIFIGLASLTLPHMILVEYCHRKLLVSNKAVEF